MKKDKAVRKAEIKAALKKQLKSLAGPLVILLIITIGVLVITFWKEEPEQAEIIKVNAYEGEEKDFVLENDKLKFTMDSATTQFTVTDKSSGQVWYSNPPEADSDSLALNVDRDKLKSTLLLTYSTINGVDTLYSNYTYSMEKQIYDIEAGEDYIKVYYSIGDMEKEYIIPPVITQERMESFLANMSNSNAVMVGEYYKKYDINKLGKKDNKEELLASYPILESEVIYVLRDTTKDNIKSKFEIYFEEAGYTLEDYQADKELDYTVKSSEKPVFNVNMVYRLEGDDLIVEIPMSEIEYKEDYPLLYLNVLPFFGAGGTEEEGFLLVPEGGGSIINFNNGKLAQNSYYANVYGWDMAQDRSAVVHETRAYYNVFGVSKKDSSFLCMMEEGAPYASVQADISGRNNSYNYVNAIYSIVHREQYDVADKYNGNMFVYEKGIPDENLVHRYRFIDSGSYVDMAKEYGNYLQEQYGDYLTMNEDTQTPVAIEILGAADKVKQVMGIPVSKPLKLTGYAESAELLARLQEDGIENMSVKLSGWMNGGVQQKFLSRTKLISELGGKKDFNKLVSYAADNGIPLYLDGVTNYAYDSDIFDGFMVVRDGARFVSKEKAELLEYSNVTYGKLEDEDEYYLLKADVIDRMAQNLADKAQSYGANVSFHDIGRELSSDFNPKASVSRQKALDIQTARLKEIKDSGMGIMINMGNDYAVAYSDMVTNMDLGGSEYTIIDKAVPFYQMAIHGYVNYTGESLNLTQDYEDELLRSAEYGAGLSFTLMGESSFVLQNTMYSKYFGADFEAWHDRLTEIYDRYNESLGHIYHQKMVDHEFLGEKLTCTTYEDGTRVYVNYSYEDSTAADGTVVPARDYVVIQ